MAKFAMFFLGYGLEDFAYEIPTKPDFTLFGDWEDPDCGIGYGVFL